MENVNVILASGSPRRRELLAGLGWKFRVVAPDADETPRPGEPPEELCVRLAELKARAAAETMAKETLSNPEGPRGGRASSVPLSFNLIIAADTVVVVGSLVLGKPADKEDGLRMIKLLQGRAHEVLTGVAVLWNGRALSALERTKVIFRPLDDAAALAYAESGEGMDKAGAYAIQGKGSLLVSSIEGDYFNVVGLPLCRLGAVLEGLGLNLPRQWGII